MSPDVPVQQFTPGHNCRDIRGEFDADTIVLSASIEHCIVQRGDLARLRIGDRYRDMRVTERLGSRVVLSAA